MRFPPTNHTEKVTQPAMCEGRANLALSPSRDLHSSIQCRTVRQSSRSPSINNDQPLPPEEYIYTETVKSIGNNEFIEEKRLLKRASWSPAALHEHGLPPNGKRQEIELVSTSRNSNRVRLRPKTGHHYQSQETTPAHARPVSYSERYNRRIFDYQQQQHQQQQQQFLSVSEPEEEEDIRKVFKSSSYSSYSISRCEQIRLHHLLQFLSTIP